MLPMQPLAFYLVRMPLHGLLTAFLGDGPLLTAVSLTYAPLTEEPAKWLVLLVPAVRRALTKERRSPSRSRPGSGLGLGEIRFIAERLHRVPTVAALPFWQFGGFLVERTIVCFLHGAFVAFAFARLAVGRAFLPGALIGTRPPLRPEPADPVHRHRPLRPRPRDLADDRLPRLLAMTGALLVVTSRLGGGSLQRAALGTATCPGCGTTYDRPWFAINLLGFKRYESAALSRRKWHVV